MVEFALVLPLLLLILCGILDFGWLFYNQFNVDNTARQAARTICTECADRDFNDTVDDAVEIVRDQIYNEDTLPETGGVTLMLSACLTFDTTLPLWSKSSTVTPPVSGKVSSL